MVADSISLRCWISRSRVNANRDQRPIGPTPAVASTRDEGVRNMTADLIVVAVVVGLLAGWLADVVTKGGGMA